MWVCRLRSLQSDRAFCTIYNQTEIKIKREKNSNKIKRYEYHYNNFSLLQRKFHFMVATARSATTTTATNSCFVVPSLFFFLLLRLHRCDVYSSGDGGGSSKCTRQQRLARTHTHTCSRMHSQWQKKTNCKNIGAWRRVKSRIKYREKEIYRYICLCVYIIGSHCGALCVGRLVDWQLCIHSDHPFFLVAVVHFFPFRLLCIWWQYFESIWLRASTIE